MKQKLEFYILSIFLLFLLIFINKVPYNFDRGSHFIGWYLLFSKHLIVIISLVFMVLGVYYYFKFRYKYVQGAASKVLKVNAVDNINFESVTFLATYIVPLACIDLDKDRSEFMLITILVLIGWIYIKTNLFYTNPTLAIWGYQIYKVSGSNLQNVTIIIRGKIIIDDTIYLKKIDDKIYLGTK